LARSLGRSKMMIGRILAFASPVPFAAVWARFLHLEQHSIVALLLAVNVLHGVREVLVAMVFGLTARLVPAHRARGDQQRNEFLNVGLFARGGYSSRDSMRNSRPRRPGGGFHRWCGQR
jgi:hypothetical protein